MTHNGLLVDCECRLDWLVAGVVMEIKAVPDLVPIGEAQLLTWIKLVGLKVELMANLNVLGRKQGVCGRAGARRRGGSIATFSKPLRARVGL